MATQKTTSSTIPCGDYNYIFLNPPDTQFITFIRFKNPKDVQKGIVGTKDGNLPSKAGPIDTTTVLTAGQTHIRLFYIGEDNGDAVCEAMLPDANLDATHPANAWITQGPLLTFEDKVSSGTRGVDSNAFLSASVSQGNAIVVFKARDGKRKDYIQYCAFDGSDWSSKSLDIPKQTPTQPSPQT